MSNWTLQLSFKNHRGISYHMAVDIDDSIANDLQRIAPPLKGPIGATFVDVIKLLKTKQFRKDLFVKEATRLGYLLAERMEDAEGWHDESRIESAKKQLSQSGLEERK